MTSSKDSFKKHILFLLFLSILLSLFTAFKSHMNNWLIFKASFFHLMDGTSLYIPYPQDHDDLFKYSPSFALLMAPLSILPAWLGAVLWNLIGTGLFLWALVQMPLSNSQRKGVFWISLPEFIGSTQGFQSNIHMVSLLFLFWVALENKQSHLASLNLIGSFFIKIFGILGGCLLVFKEYSTSSWSFFFKLLLSLSLTTLLFIFLPLPFIGWDSLMFQYQEWFRLLKMDAAQSYGFSLMGILHGVFGLNPPRLFLQASGGLIMLLAFFLNRGGDQRTRLLGLVAICYFMILFNHKSESPTFIIAMMAFGVHQSLIPNKKWRWLLIVFTLVCVSLLYSDLFRHFKQSHFDPIAVKVWPFVALFPYNLFQILKSKKTNLSLS